MIAVEEMKKNYSNVSSDCRQSEYGCDKTSCAYVVFYLSYFLCQQSRCYIAVYKDSNVTSFILRIHIIDLGMEKYFV